MPRNRRSRRSHRRAGHPSPWSRPHTRWSLAPRLAAPARWAQSPRVAAKESGLSCRPDRRLRASSRRRRTRRPGRPRRLGVETAGWRGHLPRDARAGLRVPRRGHIRHHREAAAVRSPETGPVLAEFLKRRGIARLCLISGMQFPGTGCFVRAKQALHLCVRLGRAALRPRLRINRSPPMAAPPAATDQRALAAERVACSEASGLGWGIGSCRWQRAPCLIARTNTAMPPSSK